MQCVELEWLTRVWVCLLPCKHSPAAPWKGIWMLLSEDVAHPAAGDDLQTSTTLPHTK